MANAYFYSNTAVETELTGGITSGATSMTVLNTTGYPSVPFVAAIDYGAASEELVKVTAVVGATFTVTRGFGSTSAQSHSLGAKVRHVVNAVDLTDFRTHEATTTAHGVTGDIVGTGGSQTLANKTLTAPSVTNGSFTGGGFMSGTWTGTPTFSGSPAFTGTPFFTTGTTTFAGTTNIGGTPTFTTTPTFTGSSVAIAAKVTGDAQDRFEVTNTGIILMGPGNATQDVNLYRSAANTLKTDDSLVVNQMFSAGNIAIGVSSVTPVASTPTSFLVSGLNLVPGTYRAFVCASTSAPGTVQEVTANSVSNDGFTGWIYRTSTTVTSVQWLLIGA